MIKLSYFLSPFLGALSALSAQPVTMEFDPQYDNATDAVFSHCGISYLPSDGGNIVCINHEKWGANSGKRFTPFRDTFATESAYGTLKIVDSSGKYTAEFKVSQDGIEVINSSLPGGQVAQVLKPDRPEDNPYFVWIELGNFWGNKRSSEKF